MSTRSPSDVQRIVALAKETSGAFATVSQGLWNLAARHAYTLEGEEAADSDLVATTLRVIQEAEEADKNTTGGLAPPPVAESSASSYRDDNGEGRIRQQKFDERILPKTLHCGQFVQVPSYLAFVEGMSDETPLQPITKQILEECPEDWCPKPKSLESPNLYRETPRSANLARAIARELNDDGISVCHQVPILPKEKSVERQVVDIGIFVHGLNNLTLAHVGAVISYKAHATGGFGDYASQAAAYGTDYMNISKRSMIVIQVHGGFQTGTDLSILAFGITPSVTGGYLKAFLFEGSGYDGLQKLVAGLKRFTDRYRHEREGHWPAQWLSNATAIHGRNKFIVKSYDFRDNQTAEKDRRVPNIALIRKFIDPSAKLIELAESLSIVKMKFYGREKGTAKWWYDAVPAKGLGDIILQLRELHNMGYVHGDIRLSNMVPHAGKLVDFDYTREDGTCYPSTFNSLPWDGQRATEVDDAISNGTIASCEMRPSHDLDSMLFVLQLYQPDAHSAPKFQRWWKSTIPRYKNKGYNLYVLADSLIEHCDQLVRLKFDHTRS